jgi:DNA-binding response OmpR family regulator
VIVLDHDLSGVHGDTLCRMPTDDDPAMILMLTAANAPTQRFAGLALGADDHPPNRRTARARPPRPRAWPP